ncbi:MAG: hypothetical protein N4A44_04050 [Alphaproteobacteria bacterium]|jgi:hypothetical protein|nr:hypothetical protein [Alphaproteobacteria bacterium]
MGKIEKFKEERSIARFLKCFSISGLNPKLATFLFFGNGIYLPTTLLSILDRRIREILLEEPKFLQTKKISFKLLKNEVGAYALDISTPNSRSLMVIYKDRVDYLSYYLDVKKFFDKSDEVIVLRSKGRFTVRMEKINRAKIWRARKVAA